MAQPQSVEQENEATLDYNRAAARKGRELKKLKVAATAPAAVAHWIKRAQFVLDVITAVSFVMTLITGGLDFIDATTFFVTANGQLMLHYFIPEWPVKQWRIITVVILDFIILSVLLIVYGMFAFIGEYPNEACQILGESTGSLILQGLGKVGACKWAGDVLQWVAQ